MKRNILATTILLAIEIIGFFMFLIFLNMGNSVSETVGTNIALGHVQVKGEGEERIPLEVSTNNNIAYDLYNTCLENTIDERRAKDCCDCLSVDELIRKTCRDATVAYDFSKNTTIKEFSIPSTLGKDGDYSAFTVSGNEQECKQACESESGGLVCGDYQYCRTACNNLSK